MTGRSDVADRFLLCSDGLFKALPHDRVAAALRDGDCKTATERLLAAALARHASDNVTVVTVETAL
jgi:protein phosphatase/serine/threonine-protein phosphatase Stp1